MKFEDINEAFARETQIKAGKRKTKIKLIESINPNWDDLYETIRNKYLEEMFE
jgi:putative endonuclease